MNAPAAGRERTVIAGWVNAVSPSGSIQYQSGAGSSSRAWSLMPKAPTCDSDSELNGPKT
jgi:hypothetical protein